jgi:hypothetical protein
MGGLFAIVFWFAVLVRLFLWRVGRLYRSSLRRFWHNEEDMTEG